MYFWPRTAPVQNAVCHGILMGGVEVRTATGSCNLSQPLPFTVPRFLSPVSATRHTMPRQISGRLRVLRLSGELLQTLPNVFCAKEYNRSLHGSHNKMARSVVIMRTLVAETCGGCTLFLPVLRGHNSVMCFSRTPFDCLLSVPALCVF